MLPWVPAKRNRQGEGVREIRLHHTSLGWKGPWRPCGQQLLGVSRDKDTIPLKKVMEKMDLSSYSKYKFIWEAHQKALQLLLDSGVLRNLASAYDTGLLEALIWSRRASHTSVSPYFKGKSNPTLKLDYREKSEDVTLQTKELQHNSVFFNQNLFNLLKGTTTFKFGCHWHCLSHRNNKFWSPRWVNIYEKVNRTSNRTGNSISCQTV